MKSEQSSYLHSASAHKKQHKSYDVKTTELPLLTSWVSLWLLHFYSVCGPDQFLPHDLSKQNEEPYVFKVALSNSMIFKNSIFRRILWMPNVERWHIFVICLRGYLYTGCFLPFFKNHYFWLFSIDFKFSHVISGKGFFQNLLTWNIDLPKVWKMNIFLNNNFSMLIYCFSSPQYSALRMRVICM